MKTPLVILGIVFIAISLFGFSYTLKGTGEKNDVVCEVQVEDPTFGAPQIRNINCNVVGKCGFTLSVAPMSILENVGNVKLFTALGDAQDSETYETFSLGQTVTRTLEVCTEANTGTIKLTDENGNTIESQEVNFNE